MHFSTYFSRTGIKAKAASAYARITLTRGTAAFFVFSFIYCFIQGIVQSFLFSTDVAYGSLVSGIVSGSGLVTRQETTFLEGTRGHLILQMCTDIPHGQKVYPCFTIFNASALASDGVSAPGPVRTLGDQWENGMQMTAGIDEQTNQPAVVLQSSNANITLSQQCVRNLAYTSQILANLRREDIAWICLQFWLLAISFLAILNDSVPHILSVLMTRFISTAWSSYSVWRGQAFSANFQELIGDPGTPCSLDIFQSFWGSRFGLQIADLLLSATGLIFFFCLSWKLLRIYSDQSFKCVGAPEHVMRIHKFFMALLASLQLEAFVLVTSGGLWIDVLMNTAIVEISAHTKLYQALFISTTILLVPWIAMGWYSIRREMKRVMIIFLGIGICIMAGWATMFYSIVYRWSFMQWPFLGCFTVASFILLLSSIILGIVCRINFGKGLAQYLHAEETLQSLNFAPDAFTVRTRTNSIKDLESRAGSGGNSGGGANFYHPGDEKFHDSEDDHDHYKSSKDFTQMYFVQTLPSRAVGGGGGGFQTESTAPSFYEYSTSRSTSDRSREERSFFTE
ncbi:hypothetical protein JR316_0010972 [Psilocybe cubensis]|uniref:Uncharacterized protein n=1 Tax=Psilocybe cubensis TaxID=181762 RepID=A0ACB8GPB2_PSICU|nr:hypothetical protein JR316_0010972 [Psilocybe cubensis]KAH9477056.1 hypothetical protein JR316_0010972 [Psilocybe cubensis]